VGLAWRTQRGALLGWVAGMLLGAVTGVLSQSMEDMVKDNPQMADYLEIVSGDSVVDAYLAAVVLIFALTAAGFAVWSAGHPGADEDEAQLDVLLATPLSRTRSLLGNLAVTLVNTVLVLLAVAVGVGVAHGIAVADSGQVWRLVGATFAYLPAIATLVGLVVLVAGWVPRWTWVGWVVLAFSFVIGWLGGLLDPPDWVRDLSPFSHIPYVPVESAASRGPAVLAVVAALLVFGGLVGFHRRDVGVG
jgi:ABC-2 type transport system permease protein